jgi:hypothetical protein
MAEKARGPAAIMINRADEEHFWPDGRALAGEIRIGTNWATSSASSTTSWSTV